MSSSVDSSTAAMGVNVAAKVRSGLLWSAIRNWGSRLAGFVIYFQLVRLLDPASIGAFAAAFAVFAFLEIFVDQGLGDAIVQRDTLSQGQLNTVFLVNLAVAMVLVGGIWLGAPQIEKAMKIGGLTHILQIGSLSMLINALGFCQLALFRRNFEFKRLAMRGLASTVVGGVVGVIMAWLGYGVWALVVQLLVAAVVNLVLLWWRPLWKPNRELDFSGLWQMSHFGFNILGIKIIEFGNYRLIELAVGFWLGAVSLGLYSVGSKLYYIFAQLLGAVLMDVAMPAFSRLAGDPPRMRQAYYRSVLMTVFFAVPGWILVSALAPELCRIAFGARWAGSEAILLPLGVLGAFQALQYYDGTVLNALGKPSYSLLLSIVKTVLTVSSLLITHEWSLQAIVLGYVFAQLVTVPLSYWLVRRTLQISLRSLLPQIAPFIAAVAVMWACIYFVTAPIAGLPPVAKLVIKGVLGGGVYLGILGLFGRTHLVGVISTLRKLKHD